MIILTEEQALHVRGVTTEGRVLKPVPLIDGEFALPEECLADPAHTVHHPLLARLPTRAVAENEMLRWKAESVLEDRQSKATPEDQAKLELWG